MTLNKSKTLKQIFLSKISIQLDEWVTSCEKLWNALTIIYKIKWGEFGCYIPEEGQYSQTLMQVKINWVLAVC